MPTNKTSPTNISQKRKRSRQNHPRTYTRDNPSPVPLKNSLDPYILEIPKTNFLLSQSPIELKNEIEKEELTPKLAGSILKDAQNEQSETELPEKIQAKEITEQIQKEEKVNLDESQNLKEISQLNTFKAENSTPNLEDTNNPKSEMNQLRLQIESLYSQNTELQTIIRNLNLAQTKSLVDDEREKSLLMKKRLKGDFSLFENQLQEKDELIREFSEKLAIFEKNSVPKDKVEKLVLAVLDKDNVIKELEKKIESQTNESQELINLKTKDPSEQKDFYSMILKKKNEKIKYLIKELNSLKKTKVIINQDNIKRESISFKDQQTWKNSVLKEEENLKRRTSLSKNDTLKNYLLRNHSGRSPVRRIRIESKTNPFRLNYDEIRSKEQLTDMDKEIKIVVNNEYGFHESKLQQASNSLLKESNFSDVKRQSSNFRKYNPGSLLAYENKVVHNNPERLRRSQRIFSVRSSVNTDKIQRRVSYSRKSPTSIKVSNLRSSFREYY